MKTEGEMIGNALRVKIEGVRNYRKNISTVSGAVLWKRITSLISKCTSAQLIQKYNAKIKAVSVAIFTEPFKGLGWK